eukprot:6196905-Pleurochrysis_carterae.AAC.1
MHHRGCMQFFHILVVGLAAHQANAEPLQSGTHPARSKPKLVEVPPQKDKEQVVITLRLPRLGSRLRRQGGTQEQHAPEQARTEQL